MPGAAEGLRCDTNQALVICKGQTSSTGTVVNLHGYIDFVFNLEF